MHPNPLLCSSCLSDSWSRHAWLGIGLARRSEHPDCSSHNYSGDFRKQLHERAAIQKVERGCQKKGCRCYSKRPSDQIERSWCFGGRFAANRDRRNPFSRRNSGKIQQVPHRLKCNDWINRYYKEISLWEQCQYQLLSDFRYQSGGRHRHDDCSLCGSQHCLKHA